MGSEEVGVHIAPAGTVPRTSWRGDPDPGGSDVRVPAHCLTARLPPQPPGLPRLTSGEQSGKTVFLPTANEHMARLKSCGQWKLGQGFVGAGR